MSVPSRVCKLTLLAVVAWIPAVRLAAQNIAPESSYAEVARILTTRVEHEMQDKQLPALSIALVDDQQIVWAQGFGYQDAAKTTPATAHTVYRVGSVSKLFTDIAVMQRVERGELDLDAPVTRYLPEFAPHSNFPGAITLRELMSHRSGLVREPPIGNYFDASSPSLHDTIESLNYTSLVAAPGAETKYSNAGVATVGYVLQTIARQPYPEYLKTSLLQPLGMTESAFAPEPQLMSRLAAASMWSYDGLNFAAPTFQLGEGPAGAMYSTVTDLGKFLSVLFAQGRAASGQIIRPETLRAMLQPQFASSGQPAAFGLGFRLSSLDGESEIGHGGAIYGFATQVSGLPGQKLGVVVITTLDCANAVTEHLAEDGLHLMLANRKHQPLSLPPFATDLPSAFAQKLAGDYAAGDDQIHMDERNGSLFLLPLKGGYLAKLKSAPDGLMKDSRIAYSPAPITPHFDATGAPSLTIGTKTYTRIPSAMPQPADAHRAELIGEYGWDYDKLYVLEQNEKLYILVEWFDFEPLTLLQGDSYKLPNRGLYVDEKLEFLRGSDGKVTGLKIGEVTFPRRPENAPGAVFQITPLKPVEELRKEALASTPPKEQGNFLQPDLVELTSLDPSIRLDIRYATNRNFLGSPLYLQARAYMQRPAAEAVARASQHLHAMGFGLLIHDSYRPWYVTKMFWDGTPDDKKIFVANPAEGSRHNRGCAVDLTLYDLKTGQPILMTGGYDEMSERSYPFYPGGTSLQRWHRDLLRHAMEAEGFTVYEYEWWHFDYKEWRRYPILNLTFEQLDQQKQTSALIVK